MDLGPKRRVLQRILSECLRCVRQYGDLAEPEFDAATQDLPALLRKWAAQLEAPPDGLIGRAELPGFEGYALWADTYDQWEANSVIAGEEEVIWDLIGDVRGRRVLDVGCGTGRHALVLAAQGAEVVGLDPSPEMLDRAREKARARGLRVTLRQAAVSVLPARLGAYDLVLCCLVLSHVADLSEAVSVLASHVRPGGRVILSDFHPFNLLIGLRTSCVGDGAKYVVPNYLHLPSEYFGALSSAGLRVTHFQEAGRLSGLPGLPATLVVQAQRAVSPLTGTT
jgi:ubiquinone/menaquinone biosynthesis C-methylase UbiE